MQIKIIGAATSDVPPAWQQSNIEYLGLSTKEEVERQMRTCRLFIAPVANNFGSKIKVLECLSRGTPIIASPGALSGIPFSDQLPKFSLGDPAGAARLVAKFTRNRDDAVKLSAKLKDLNREFCSSRSHRWAELLLAIKARPLRRRRNFSLVSPLRRPRTERLDTTNPWPAEFEVGVKEPIGVSSVGLYDVEKLDGQPLRWSTPKASLRIRLNHQTLPRKLVIRLHDIPYSIGLDLTLFANGTQIYRGVVEAGFNKILTLPNLTNEPELEICVSTQGFQAPGDTRRLGVALHSLLLCQ
jgi:hypothetical protein